MFKSAAALAILPTLASRSRPRRWSEGSGREGISVMLEKGREGRKKRNKKSSLLVGVGVGTKTFLVTVLVCHSVATAALLRH